MYLGDSFSSVWARDNYSIQESIKMDLVREFQYKIQGATLVSYVVSSSLNEILVISFYWCHFKLYMIYCSLGIPGCMSVVGLEKIVQAEGKCKIYKVTWFYFLA